MASIEDLKVYHEFVELLKYTYEIMKKFPKSEAMGISSDIKNCTTKSLENIILADKTFNILEKTSFLSKADSQLKLLKVLVRISYKEKYISSRNYGTWSRKISNVTILIYGWLKRCQKQ